MSDIKTHPSLTFIKRKDLAEGHFIMWFKPSEPFSFEPGQYITLGIDKTLRPYSIVSAPHEENVELFLEMVPKELRTEKSLTPKLDALTLGDQVAMRPKAKGRFVLDPEAETHVMIATVTGIAPFISMARAALHGHYKQSFKKPFYIFQGASYHNELGYQEELTELAKTGKVVYVPTISRPKEERNKGWSGQTGRVNVIIDDLLKKYNITADGKTTVYLCGNRGMIEDLGNKRESPDKPLGRLLKRGFKVREEIYF